MFGGPGFEPDASQLFPPEWSKIPKTSPPEVASEMPSRPVFPPPVGRPVGPVGHLQGVPRETPQGRPCMPPQGGRDLC